LAEVFMQPLCRS